MEVHHHTHSSRKKWTHYLFEFLMLFLAVFCGFLAECQLEHKIEKDRELNYMQSMVEDLKFDTTWLARNINLRQERKEMVDSLILLLSLPDYRHHTNSIMAYNQKMRSYIFELTDEIELRSEYRTIAGEVFDGNIFNKMIDSNRVAKPVNAPALFSNDPALLNKVIVKAQYLKKLDQNQVIRAAEMKKQAMGLINTIKNEYHLN